MIRVFKFKHRDGVIAHKLRGDRAMNQIGEFRLANREVLLYLYDSHFIRSALGLNGKDVVRAPLIHADVYFIGFNLPHTRRRCSQMALEGVAGDAGKNIDQAIVSGSE